MDDQKQARQQATLERLDRFSRFTDSSIRIPFTRFELGAEALIGEVFRGAPVPRIVTKLGYTEERSET